MAKRPYFVVGNDEITIVEREADFVYSPGFAPSQKRKNVVALHEAIAKISPTTELAVGNSPAPGPERVMLPTG